MPTKILTDTAGSTLTIMDLDGYYIANSNLLPNHEEELRSMPDWRARDDDLMICTYPKSGTHWLWEIVSMLVMKKGERVPVVKATAMMELIAKATHDDIPSPRVLNSHMYFEYLPKDFAKRKCKIIYMMRNPKDVAVSFFNHHRKLISYNFSGTWEDYVPRYLKGDVDYGSWFDYTRKWEKFMEDNPESPIFMTTFEDMKEVKLAIRRTGSRWRKVNCLIVFTRKNERLEGSTKIYSVIVISHKTCVNSHRLATDVETVMELCFQKY